jgi:L-seryl-tRNA(Ser) seleniumtransferase
MSDRDPRPSGPRPPSVDRVLRAAADRFDGRDRDAVVREARAVVEEERSRLARGNVPSTVDALADSVIHRLVGFEDARSDGVMRVINATGVVLHTNLGRAPWPAAAVRAAAEAAAASLLELDSDTGRRGARFRVAEEHVIALTGAEDALITNNNAAAVALAVSLAGRGGVAVSRGELVEIGGGVRIPDIVRRAGAKLVEVGTTNRTRVADFEEALEVGRAKVVLRVHPSNFVQAGFVEGPDPEALAEAANRLGAIVIDDLGSGALLDTSEFGLAHEPTPSERLSAGADLVTFSGDKLVGGPQAGIIAGRADLVARLRRDPLARAMRPDKAMLAAIAATLGLYRAGVAHREIPIWRQIGSSADALEARGRAVLDGVLAGLLDSSEHFAIALVPSESTIGGGSLPGQTLPSWAISISGSSPDRLLTALRAGSSAVIGHIVDDAVLLDLRTVEPADDEALGAAVATAIGTQSRGGR